MRQKINYFSVDNSNIHELMGILSNSQASTFFVLASRMDYNNELYISKKVRGEICDTLSVSRSTLAHTLTGMVKVGSIFHLSVNHYMINPFFAGRGSTFDIERLRKNIRRVCGEYKLKGDKKFVADDDINIEFLRKQASELSDYGDFLKSEYWDVVKNMVKERDGNKCVDCKSIKNLHVHHKTYINHFNEHKHLSDLITLCKTCHDYVHGNNIR